MSTFKKAWLLLNKSQRKYIYFIFILMFFSMILEILSIGIIIPLLSLLIKGNADVSFFNHFLFFGQLTKTNLIYIGLLVTVIIFSIKNLFLIFNLWQQSKFMAKMNVEFSDRLFKYYLKKDYMFFLETNTSLLHRNVTFEVVSFVDYINKTIIILNEIIIFLGIICILLYADILGTLIILTLIGVFFLITYFSTRKRIDSLGKEKIIIRGEANKHILQGFMAAKEVKILDRIEDLTQQLYHNFLKLHKNYLVTRFITGLPRFAFEILIATTFAVLIVFMLKTNKETVDIIQYLGVFAIASFRLVPGAAKLISSYQGLRYGGPSVKLISNELFSKKNELHKEEKSNISMDFQKNINLKNLSFSYPSRKEFSLSKISMTIKKGDFIGIIGETGSGKSTLINLLIGLLNPIEGKIEVDELNIHSNLSKWYKKIGYIPQSVYLLDDTVRKNIAFGLKNEDIDDSLIQKAVDKASLGKFLNELPNGLDTIVGENGIRISGGQLQRIGIARALYRDPEILILDEATSSLDKLTEKKIIESIQFLKRKKTIIIITHRLSTVENCDKIFFIDRGKITKQGSPKEILNNI